MLLLKPSNLHISNDKKGKKIYFTNQNKSIVKDFISLFAKKKIECNYKFLDFTILWKVETLLRLSRWSTFIKSIHSQKGSTWYSFNFDFLLNSLFDCLMSFSFVFGNFLIHYFFIWFPSAQNLSISFSKAFNSKH